MQGEASDAKLYAAQPHPKPRRVLPQMPTALPSPTEQQRWTSAQYCVLTPPLQAQTPVAVFSPRLAHSLLSLGGMPV